MTSLPPQRRDAVQNRAAILQAAASIFSEQGVDAPLDFVAQRAGVGRATLYRNFEDRNALLFALLRSDIDHLEQIARSDEADESFFVLLERFERIFSERATLLAALNHLSVDPERQKLIRARLIRIFQESFEKAKSAGALRPELTIEDIPAILRLIAMAVIDRGRVFPAEERERLKSIILEGIRLRSIGA